MEQERELSIRILQAVQKHEANGDAVFSEQIDVPGYTDLQVTQCMLRLAERALIRGRDCGAMDGPSFLALGITSSGLEYLDTAEKDTFAHHVKGKLREKWMDYVALLLAAAMGSFVTYLLMK